DSMRTILESYGLHVREYASANAFLSDTSTQDIDSCLVLDQHMPDMSGLDLLEQLRARRITIPVVMVTGRADPRLRENALRAGAAFVLDKPVNDEDLVQTIQLAIAAG